MAVTIPTSSVPSVIEYLLGAIQGQCANDALFDDMLIRIGQPGVNFPNDMIWISGTRRSQSIDTFIGSGGTDWLNEKYDVTVTISTWVGTGDADDNSVLSTQLTERVWQLIAYVETAVRNDPGLGGLVDFAYPRDVTTEGPVWTEGDPGLKVVADVVVAVSKLN